MTVQPVRLHRYDDPMLEQVLRLILHNFAYMESRIDPPSSILTTTVADLRQLCQRGEIWSIGEPPIACVCLTPLDHALGLGRLAVDDHARGQGLGKQLVELAEQRAAALGFAFVELRVRVELTENIELYQHLGFIVSGEGTHEGFDRATNLIMRKAVPKL